MDERTKRTIAQQNRRSEEVEQATEASATKVELLNTKHAAQLERAARLGASPADAGQPSLSRTQSARIPSKSLEQIVEDNQTWAEARDVADLTLDDVLSPDELAELEALGPKGRERWSAEDFLTVGCCAAFGLLATVFDDHIDLATKRGLGALGHTNIVRRMEKRGKNLPVDYTGPGFGGPGHRGRSAGHDIGRPWEALRQIREGEFAGIQWSYGTKVVEIRRGYAPKSLPEALVLWLNHLGADIVTPMSLPLPWWSLFRECDLREVRRLSAYLYDPGAEAVGLNLRSMIISKSLPVISTEVIVRVKLQLDQRASRGTFGRIGPDLQLRQDEMLLAAHAATGAASIGKTALELSAGNVLGLRHVNAPALARIGWLGWRVAEEHRRRAKERGISTWDVILMDSIQPWELPELSAL